MEKKKLVLLIAGGAIALAAGGLLAGNWADDRAEREVRRALIENDLDRVVRYGNVSASLFGGGAVLKKVTVRDPDGPYPPITIDSLSVSDVEREGGRLSALRLRCDKLRIPVLEAVQAERRSRQGATLNADAWAPGMVGLGYPVLNGSLDLYGKLDAERGKGRLELSFDFADLGSGEVKLGLANVDTRGLVDLPALAAQAKAGNGLAQLGVLLGKGPAVVDLLVRLELAELVVGIKDQGLRQRLLGEMAEEEFLTDPPDRVAADTAVRVGRNVKQALAAQNLAPALADDLAGKVGRFVEKGGSLRLTTRIDRPLPLFQRSRSWMGFEPASGFNSLDHFFALTGARLEG